MAYEPQLLAPIEGGGLVEYYKPWLIGREAFPFIEDAYCWRGTVRKREGYGFLAALPFGPVMGLGNYIIPSTAAPQLIGFNRNRAYLFDNGTSTFSSIAFYSDATPFQWTGTDLDYFYTSNYANAMWATNFLDPIRFYNGNPAAGWSNQQPIVNGTTRLNTCQMIFPYRGRLLALNTVEDATPFRQRARWCQVLGSPYVSAAPGDKPTAQPAPFNIDDDSWRDDIPGKGGFIDADTTERIIAAAIVRDTLIVFFQKSTWRLRYVGNEVLPFLWERINTQYGADSTFSTIEFDDNSLAYSKYGYIAADTNGVERIDEKIPDKSFQDTEFGTGIKNLQRVHGLRDFYRQTAYWAYPEKNVADFPNKVLAYNYIDKTWSIFNQSFTCFGNYSTFDDKKWQDFPPPDVQNIWDNQVYPWDAPWLQSQFPQILAGAQDGSVFILFDTTDNATDNGIPFGFAIDTKFLNPYIKDGCRVRVPYVDLYCDRTDGGEITVECYIDDNMETPVKTLIVSTDDNTNSAKYVRIFIGIIARVIRFRFTLSADQIADPVKGTAPFVIQGLVIWTRKEGRLKR